MGPKTGPKQKHKAGAGRGGAGRQGQGRYRHQGSGASRSAQRLNRPQAAPGKPPARSGLGNLRCSFRRTRSKGAKPGPPVPRTDTDAQGLRGGRGEPQPRARRDGGPHVSLAPSPQGPGLGRPCRLPRSLCTDSNPPTGRLCKDRGAHFPARPGPHSAGVERGRRPQTLPPRPRGCLLPGTAEPRGPKVPRAATAGPGAGGRRKRALRGHRRDHAPRGPRVAPRRGRPGRPRAGLRWRPPQPGPTRPPQEGGSGRLSGRTSGGSRGGRR